MSSTPAYSEGPLPLHLLFSSDKDWPQRNPVWEGEFSVLSPLTISSLSGMSLHYWLCHMISCRTPSPTRIFPRLGTQHPPANCPTIQNRRSPFGELFPASKNSSQDIESESSPMKLASFNNFCIRQKWRIFQIELTGHITKKKNKTKRENKLSHPAQVCWQKCPFNFHMISGAERKKCLYLGLFYWEEEC